MLVTHQAPTTDHAATGENNRAIRQKTKVSIRKLAAGMEISPQFLSDLELGRRTWTATLDSKYHSALKKLLGK